MIPGPRVGEAARAVASVLHPQLFPEAAFHDVHYLQPSAAGIWWPDTAVSRSCAGSLSNWLRVKFSASLGQMVQARVPLIKALGGVLKVESGEVRADDQPIGILKGRDRARRIAVVTQNARLEFPFTVRALSPKGVTRTWDRFNGWAWKTKNAWTPRSGKLD